MGLNCNESSTVNQWYHASEGRNYISAAVAIGYNGITRHHRADYLPELLEHWMGWEIRVMTGYFHMLCNFIAARMKDML